MLDAVKGLSEPYKRSIRLSIVVFLACCIGYGLLVPGEGVPMHYRKEFSNGLKWSAITCIVVSAPVIGRAAATGAERILGTVVGGWLAYGVFHIGSLFWGSYSDGVVLAVSAALVAFSSVIIGVKYKLENSTKLYALTFMLVSFGAESLQSRQGAFKLTLTRILGICFGVVLSAISSVIIFPKSATEEALIFMRKALKNLAELNAMAWQHGPLFRPEWKDLMPLQGTIDWSMYHYHEGVSWQEMDEREAKFEEECEKLLMQTYDHLNKVAEYLPQAKSEVYVGHVRDSLCFLPGLPWVQLGTTVLPPAEIQEMSTSIRKVARLLWTIHLSFQDGFDQNVLDMLKQQYPEGLMPNLAQQTQGCLQDAFNAFPNASYLETRHLKGLMAGVESLLRISDYQRRRITHHIRRNQLASRSRSRALPVSVDPRARANSSPFVTARTGESMPSTSNQPKPSPAPREYQFSRNSRSRRFDLMESKASVDNRPAWLTAIAPTPSSEGPLKEPLLGPGAATDSERDTTVQIQSPANAQPPDGAPDQSTLMSGTNPTAATSYGDHPEDVFRNLPDGLRISLEPNSSCSSPGKSHPYDMESDNDSALSIHLHPIPSTELLVFPETAEGYVDKVRWYSFQFLMEELAEEIEYLHEVLSRLLHKLPQPCLKP